MYINVYINVYIHEEMLESAIDLEVKIGSFIFFYLIFSKKEKEKDYLTDLRGDFSVAEGKTHGARSDGRQAG